MRRDAALCICANDNCIMFNESGQGVLVSTTPHPTGRFSGTKVAIPQWHATSAALTSSVWLELRLLPVPRQHRSGRASHNVVRCHAALACRFQLR